MQITPIPFQDMARHLKMVAGAEIAFALRPDNLGTLQCIPTQVLDRIITRLDGQSALQLKITCVAFSVLVKRNSRQETWYTLRFFDLASYQIAKDQRTRENEDVTLQNIAYQVACRGDLITAFKITEQLEAASMRMMPYRRIAIMQALEGKITEARATLKRISDIQCRISSYERIVKELAKRGNYPLALEVAKLIPTTYPWTVRRAYKIILRSQWARGDTVGIQQTVDSLQKPNDPIWVTTVIEKMNRTRAQRAVDLQNPAAIQDLLLRSKLYKKGALNLVKKGDLEGAQTLVQLIGDCGTKCSAYTEIVKILASRGEFQLAITLSNEKLLGFYKREAQQRIGVEKAKRGDFQGSLEILCQIDDFSSRAQAYQQVVTVLLDMVTDE